MNILVIDNAGWLALLLAELGLEVLSVADEVQALNAAEQQKPEIIFLDYANRGDQTPEYISLLLDVSDGSKLVVIGENIDEDDVFRCLLMGANGFQDKQQLPYYINKLVKVVADGEAWVSRKMVARILSTLRQINSEALNA